MSHEDAGSVGREIAALQSAIGWLASLGDHAYFQVVEYDAKIDATTPDWPDLDVNAQESYASELTDLLDREEQMPPREGLWGKYLSPDAYRELHDAAARYHGSLPFSEAERNWLFTTYRHVDETYKEGYGAQRITLGLMEQRGEIVSMGKPEIVMGAELVRRWWAWRRGTDEYEGSGAYERTRVAVTDLLALVGERE